MFDILLEILKNYEVENLECVTEKSGIFTEMLIDSMTIMSVINDVEVRFKIEFLENELNFDETLTMGELVSLIEKKYLKIGEEDFVI